jgi:flavorubredoxin
MHTKLKPGVYWVGVSDWELRHFHGHELSTHRGSTYNSYLIVDEKIALIDTVWKPFTKQLLENIREIVDPARIDYIVANHSEADHAGALAEVVRFAPNATLVVSNRGQESVEGHHHQGWEYKAVGTGDMISLGETSLVFIETPMLHWPDSMFTYLTDKNILFPNDAFGQHYATAFRFNDEVDQCELFEECLKYYANILTPYSSQVLKTLDEFCGVNVPVEMIAPSHGVIWRKDPMQIVEKYATWAKQEPEPRAVIIYDTMWNGTRRMAEVIGEGLAEVGVDHKIFHAAAADRNDTLKEVFRARTVLVGSSTLNNGILPTIWPLLQDIRGLKFKNKLGGAFGTYGWSGEGVQMIEDHLCNSNLEIFADGIRCKWQPTDKALEDCRSFGFMAGKKTLYACKGICNE